jgi:N-methylhydantoinase B
VRAEIIRQRLVSIAEEAESVILRTSYSSSISEAKDFSAAIYDSDVQLIGQTRQSLGGFVGTVGRGLRALLKVIPPESLRPGDTIITNDPWMGGGHLPDVMTMRPIFLKGRIVAYAANVVHVSDLGGIRTAEATDLFEEGLQIPPSFLYRENRLNDDVFKFIQANSRLPHQLAGDVQAQHSANTLLEKRVLQLLEQYGMDDFDATSTLLQDRAELAMRERVKKLPDGIYNSEVYSDGIGEPIKLAVSLEVSGSSIHLDFAGTSDQVAWGWNVPFNLTCAEAVYALRVVLGPDIPLLEGSFRPFTFAAPEGCILNARFPAPTMVRTIIVHNVSSLIYRALSDFVPDVIPPADICANFGGLWTFRFRGLNDHVPSAYKFGGPPQMRRAYTETYFFSGGTGAFGDGDGLPTLASPTNCANIPVEIMESRAPVVFESKRFTPDSGGPGQFRGGLGQQVEVRVLSDVPIDFIPANHDRINQPPFGLFGGKPGRGGSMLVDGSPTPRQKGQRVFRDQIVTVGIPGGGGFGDPSARGDEAVLADVRAGYVTTEGALADYGVVVPGPQ